RRRPLPLRAGGSALVHDLRGDLLLVPEGHRSHARRDARPVALLAARDRLQHDLPAAALRRIRRDAAAHLHLRAGPRLRGLEPDLLGRRDLPGGGGRLLPGERDPRAAARGARGQRPLGRLDARVVDLVAAAGLQLRDAPRGAQPPPALGSQAPGRSRLEIRVTAATQAIPSAADWRLPDRGRVAIAALIVAETAIFTIFVAAYLYYVGKSLSGPTPRAVLRLPVLISILLWSSSVTIHLAVRALRAA